jgi:hypothetical protein
MAGKQAVDYLLIQHKRLLAIRTELAQKHGVRSNAQASPCIRENAL